LALVLALLAVVGGFVCGAYSMSFLGYALDVFV
jgi:hypothetical protein